MPTTPQHEVLQNIIFKGRPSATALIYGSKDYPNLRGTVNFYATPYGGILAEAELFHLPSYAPAGIPCFYGFHIHETGDCSDNFSKTGGHYNPEKQPHPFHAGDMPSLTSTDGYAWMLCYLRQLTIPAILGKTVIVHSHADDFTTQPSGNSGEKIGCGVIM